MIYIRVLLILLFLSHFFLLPTVFAASDSNLILSQYGKTGYQIIIPETFQNDDIKAGLQQAARLLQASFKANGAEIFIVSEAQRDPTRPAIALGDTTLARKNVIEAVQLEGWGYVHKVIGRDLIIVGHDQPAPFRSPEPRLPTWDRFGTVKGVTDFLRQYAGTRFLYPDLDARLPVVKAAGLNFLDSPALEFLKTPIIAIPSNLDVRMIPPLEFQVSSPPRGSFYDIAGNRFPLVDTLFDSHTYERAIPVDPYRSTHPEYFALIDGKRLLEGAGQYCIANPAVQELLYKDLLRQIDKGYSVVDIGQPDGFRPCQCTDCSRLYNTVDWGEKLWLLHRDLAERVAKARPGRQVMALSYMQTAEPPKAFRTFPANMRVMLSGTNEDDITLWRSVEVPAGFSGFLYNWVPNLVTRYTPMRTPGFIEEQVRRLARNRIRAVYLDGPGALFGLEGPVYYTMGRMYDDVEGNSADALVKEFCEAAFGRAAPPMLEFYDQLYRGIEVYSRYLATRAPAWVYTDGKGKARKYLTDPFQMLGFLYPPQLLKELEEKLSRAQRAADTEKVRSRLTLVRREFDYLKSTLRVVHLYHAYQVESDLALRDRLLAAIDARNALIDSWYDPRGGLTPMPGWPFVLFPPAGHSAKHLRLAYDRYQEPMADTPFNSDTQAVRKGSVKLDME